MAKKRQRPERQPAPEGGISIREAERKYSISKSTISTWVSKGYVPVLLRTKNWVYIDETVFSKLVDEYRKDPGRGKKTVKLINCFNN